MTDALTLPELMQVRRLLAEPDELQLTQLELRACRFAMLCEECGEALPEDYLLLVRKLLRSASEVG